MIHIKLYSKIKENIKDISTFIIIMAVMIFLFFFELPYYIDAPGGITNLDKRFQIEGASKSKGTYNLSYVTEYDATPVTLLYALLNPNWDIIKESDITNNEISMEDLYKMDKISLKTSAAESVIVAYQKAGKKVNIKSINPIVMFKSKEFDNNLEIGDIILYIDSKKVDKHEDISVIIKDYNVGDKVTIKVKNKDKEYDRYAYIYEDENKNILGIYCTINYIYSAEPNIKFTISENEYGSSGGLMTSLAIYDYLTPKDLTHGLTIVGTGTIDIDGKVGSIGGVKYKLKGAVNNDADIFFVPNGENYEEAIKLKKEKKYDIKIVGVSTLDDAIKYLENL